MQWKSEMITKPGKWFASMTRNNLKQHLAWLLQRGPSLYPTLQLSTQTEDRSAVAGIQFKQSQPVPEPSITATTDQQVAQLDNPAEIGVEDTVEDGNQLRTDADMARLQFAPQSASKPRLLSCGDHLSSSSPRTPTVRLNGESRSGTLRVEDRFSVKGLYKPCLALKCVFELF
jgi:hypothetical protein